MSTEIEGPEMTALDETLAHFKQSEQLKKWLMSIVGAESENQLSFYRDLNDRNLNHPEKGLHSQHLWLPSTGERARICVRHTLQEWKKHEWTLQVTLETTRADQRSTASWGSDTGGSVSLIGDIKFFEQPWQATLPGKIDFIDQF